MDKELYFANVNKQKSTDPVTESYQALLLKQCYKNYIEITGDAKLKKNDGCKIARQPIKQI